MPDIVIKTNKEWYKALIELATAANAAWSWNLENSQNVLSVISLIEQDPELDKKPEAAEKEALPEIKRATAGIPKTEKPETLVEKK